MNRAGALVLARAAKAANELPLPDRFWSKVDKRRPDECWPWKAAVRRSDEGYGAFWIEGRHWPAPKVALMLTGEVIPAGMEVCHTCDNPPCCNPAHLFVGTRQDNNNDKVSKGRHAAVERMGNALLTDAAVRAIKAAPRTAAVKRELARTYGVKPDTIYDVWRNRSWKHVV